MSIFGIDHVQLAMPEGGESEARRFYVNVLGFKEVPKPENLAKRGGVWFEAGSARLHLGVEKDFKPARKAHPAFLVSDIEALRQSCLSAGVTVIGDEQLTGYSRFYLIDPFGNRIECLQPQQGS